MPRIRTIDEQNADGRLAELYHEYAEADGTVGNVLRIHALNPDSLEAHVALYIQCMKRPGPLSHAEREVIGLVVSRINACRYCVAHHTAGLARRLPEERRHLAEALAAADHTAVDGLTAREAALAEYAARVTRDPAATSDADVDALRAAGLTDREILDATQIAGYFNYVNRMILALGVPPERDERAES